MEKENMDWITALMDRDTSELLFVQLPTGRVATMTPEEYQAYKQRKSETQGEESGKQQKRPENQSAPKQQNENM